MSAVMSPCGLYRYRLEREIREDGPAVAILGVNPSTAEAVINDPTIRKDIGFGQRHGWRKIIKGNKFAFRSAQVKVLRLQGDPIGPENDLHLWRIMQDADIVIAAWGPLAKLPKPLRERWRDVVRMAEKIGHKMQCFGVALDGQPRHTLMLDYRTPLIEWQVPA